MLEVRWRLEFIVGVGLLVGLAFEQGLTMQRLVDVILSSSNRCGEPFAESEFEAVMAKESKKEAGSKVISTFRVVKSDERIEVEWIDRGLEDDSVTAERRQIEFARIPESKQLRPMRCQVSWLCHSDRSSNPLNQLGLFHQIRCS